MKTASRKTLIYGVAITLCSTIIGLTPEIALAHDRQHVRSMLYKPESKPFDKTFGQWSAEFWQFALSIPSSANPWLDETGDNCSVGQRGPVWFLVGVFNASGTVVRNNCKIPAGKSLFFPVMDRIDINTPGLVACGKNGDVLCVDQTAQQLRDENKVIVDTITDLAVEIDGQPIENIQEKFRVRSTVFDLTFPIDNVFGAPVETFSPAIDDGYYVFLKPLPVGQHTIHFKGHQPESDAAKPFDLDVTYNLTVVPVSSEVRHRKSRRH